MNKSVKIAGVILIAISVVSISTLHCFSPISSPYPTLTGPHAVGTTTTRLIGQDQPEISITWYYPSSVKKNNTLYSAEPLAWQAYKKRMRKQSWMPSFVWNCWLSSIKSYAVPGAPAIPDKKFPIIIFSPSSSSFTTHVTYLEELASHGYIIVAVTDSSDDLKRVVDSLAEYNNDATFVLHNALNRERIGALGHAEGGKAALDLCIHDSRCKAGMSMDWFSQAMLTIKKPFMAFLGNDWAHKKEVPHVDNQELDAYFLPFVTTDVGAKAFSDSVLLRWPLSTLFGVGPHWARNAIADCIRIFFDWYVKNDLQIKQSAPKSGDIVVFNGTSSAGKSAIVNELQPLCGDKCRNIKLDDFEAFYVIKNPIIAFAGPKTYFTPERLEKRWHDFYTYAKRLALSGYHVFVDTVQFDEKYSNLLGHYQVYMILVYCPLDIIIERVAQRSKNKLERRTVAQAVGQFSEIYKIQESVTEPVVDHVQTSHIQIALDIAIKELCAMKKVPREFITKFNKDFTEQFKLKTLNEITLTIKKPWDLIVNSGSKSPHELAQMIFAYLSSRRQ